MFKIYFSTFQQYINFMIEFSYITGLNIDAKNSSIIRDSIIEDYITFQIAND